MPHSTGPSAAASTFTPITPGTLVALSIKGQDAAAVERSRVVAAIVRAALQKRWKDANAKGVSEDQYWNFDTKEFTFKNDVISEALKAAKYAAPDVIGKTHVVIQLYNHAANECRRPLRRKNIIKAQRKESAKDPDSKKELLSTLEANLQQQMQDDEIPADADLGALLATAKAELTTVSAAQRGTVTGVKRKATVTNLQRMSTLNDEIQQRKAEEVAPTRSAQADAAKKLKALLKANDLVVPDGSSLEAMRTEAVKQKTGLQDDGKRRTVKFTTVKTLVKVLGEAIRLERVVNFGTTRPEPKAESKVPAAAAAAGASSSGYTEAAPPSAAAAAAAAASDATPAMSLKACCDVLHVPTTSTIEELLQLRASIEVVPTALMPNKSKLLDGIAGAIKHKKDSADGAKGSSRVKRGNVETPDRKGKRARPAAAP
eukprot:m.20289 g.20289  ORF g.20289 m.20289 type:complete len:430 (-) comp10174_c0_seq1:179-1468(-)